MSRPDPFMSGKNPITGTPMGAVSASDRISMVREFSVKQCMQAQALPGLQANVQAAVARRLRQLAAEDNQAYAERQAQA